MTRKSGCELRYSPKIAFLGMLLVFMMPLNSSAATFRTKDRVYVTNLKPKAKIEIVVERISFRQLLSNQCGELNFDLKTTPSLVIVDKQTFYPLKFPLGSQRICTKDTPKSTQSTRIAPTKFMIAGLKPNTSLAIKIVNPDTKKVTTNSCGYSAIAITTSLTAFSKGYAENLYSVNGVKLDKMAIQEVPQCKNKYRK